MSLGLWFSVSLIYKKQTFEVLSLLSDKQEISEVRRWRVVCLNKTGKQRKAILKVFRRPSDHSYTNGDSLVFYLLLLWYRRLQKPQSRILREVKKNPQGPVLDPADISGHMSTTSTMAMHDTVGKMFRRRWRRRSWIVQEAYAVLFLATKGLNLPTEKHHSSGEAWQR